MSSPPKQAENVELKGGHSPAVKAGGMRIKAPRVHEEKLAKEDVESPWETENAKTDAKALLVAGAVAHGDKDFTPESVKASHDKPMPTNQKPVMNKQANRTIQQPR